MENRPGKFHRLRFTARLTLKLEPIPVVYPGAAGEGTLTRVPRMIYPSHPRKKA